MDYKVNQNQNKAMMPTIKKPVTNKYVTNFSIRAQNNKTWEMQVSFDSWNHELGQSPMLFFGEGVHLMWAGTGILLPDL